MQEILYRAERTVSVFDLAALLGTEAKKLFVLIGKSYLLAGEWAVLPCEGGRFFRASDLLSRAERDRLQKQGGLPFFYYGCCAPKF